MAKTLNALIYPSAPGVIAERRMIDVATIPPNKASWWRPIVVVGDDAFDPKTQKKTGPVTTIEAARVVDTYSIAGLNAQEISDAKDAAVNNLNGSIYPAILQTLLTLENEIRDLRTKLNAEVVAAGRAAPFTAGQASSINMVQLRAAIKAALT